MIHRLHRAGRPIQFAPPPMLEGSSTGSPPAGETCTASAEKHETASAETNNPASAKNNPASAEKNNPASAKKNLASAKHAAQAREIHALHALARLGEIPADVAERQLNSYLLAVGRAQPELVLPIADAPHPGLLPDLGYVVHRILSQNPLQGSLSAVLQQCLPPARQPVRPPTYEDSQDVLLNLVLALLLGLYPGGGVKKPRFEARAALFTRVHGLLTSPPEEQTAFCRGHGALVQLACMEYVARVLPANAPSQTAFIHERDPCTAVYFRRIPALCDEFRQSLDALEPPSWAEMQSSAHNAVERVARLKKSGGQAPARDPPCLAPALLRPQTNLAAYWNVPCLLGRPSPDEFRILGQGLGLAGSLICHIQREVQVQRARPSLLEHPTRPSLP